MTLRVAIALTVVNLILLRVVAAQMRPATAQSIGPQLDFRG